MDFNLILVVGFAAVFVATLVYIFVDQQRTRASQPPTISTPSARPPAPPPTAPRPALEEPVIASNRTAATQFTTTRLAGPVVVDPADGLTPAARHDLDELGGGIGGSLAAEDEPTPPISRRVPTTQPPIQPAVPAPRPRSAAFPAANYMGDTTLVTRAMPADFAAADAAFAEQPNNTALLVAPTELNTPPEYGRIFRHVTLDDADEEDEQQNYLPESRAHLSNRLILDEENNDSAPLMLIGGLILAVVVVIAVVWLLIAPAFNSDKDKAPAAQFAIVIAHFGASDDGSVSREFGNQVVSSLRNAGLNASQADVLAPAAAIGDEATAASQASHFNADLVIWGDLPNATATSLAPHYHMAVNNPPSLSQRQDLPSQMLEPTSFAFPPVSRARLEPALVDFTTGLALYYSDRVADASDQFNTALALGLDNPALHFYRASSLLQLGDNAGAIGEYAKAGGVDDVALLDDRGLAEQSLGNLAVALADYNTALKLLGSDKRTAIVYRNRAQVQLAQSQPDLANADLTLAIAADPHYAAAWYDRCSLKFDVNADPLPTSQQAANNAISDCNNALAADSQYPAAQIQRGALQLTAPQQNLDNAQADLAAVRDLLLSRLSNLSAQEAKFKEQHDHQADVVVAREVVANKQLGAAHYWMGRAYVERGKIEAQQGKGLFDFLKGPGGYDKAIDEFNAALTADPNSYDAHAWLGIALLGKGDANSAAQQFQQAQKLDPKRPLAYQQLASLYHDANQHDKAAAAYESLLQVNPGYIYGYLQLADEYKALNQADNAASAYRRAVAQQPHSGDEFRYKGIAYDSLQDYANAAANYRQAVALNTNDGRAWFNLGEDYRQLGQGNQALAAYQQAVNHNVSAAVAAYRAGLIAQQLGQVAEAQKRWQQAVAANPQFMLAYYQLAKVAQATAGQADAAIKYYEQMLRADPQTTAGEAITAADAEYDAHLQLGSLYSARAATTSDLKQQAAAYASAETNYIAAVQIAAGVADTGKQLASATSLCYVYIAEGKTDFAVKLGDSMLTVDKNYAPAYTCKGEAYLQTDDTANLSQASDNLKQAVALAPNDPAALVALGRVYQAQNQLAPAEQQFRQAIAAAPQSAAAHVGLGDIHYIRQQWAAAQQEYTAAVQFDSRSASGYTGLARTLVSQNNPGDADKDFRLAISLDPSLADPHLYRGQLLDSQKQRDAALAEYQAAVQLRPRWPLAQYLLGKAYIAKGDNKAAIDALTKASQLDPQNADAFYELGNANRAAGSGQRQAAIDAYSAAVKLNPNLAAAWYSLGLTYEDAGNHPAAADAYAHARDTATDPDLKSQAQVGLSRVGGG